MLVVSGGGAAIGATDKPGGDLILVAGNVQGLEAAATFAFRRLQPALRARPPMPWWTGRCSHRSQRPWAGKPEAPTCS